MPQASDRGAGQMRACIVWGIAAIASPAAPALAQNSDGLDVSGSVRGRYEAVENQSRVGYNRNDNIINLRSILTARYQTGPVTIGGELWDSRVYNGNTGSPVTTNEVNTFELVQAYVGVKGPIGSAKVSGQAGRFTLDLGSRRLIANDDYRNTTTGFTGLRVDLAAAKGISATAIYVLPQQRRPDDITSLLKNAVTFDHEGFDLVLWGGLVAKTKAIGPITAEASFFHLGERDEPGRPTRDRSLNTVGARLFRNPKVSRFDGEVEAFYQSGTISASTAANAVTLPVSAWFIHASGGYSFPGSLKARVALQYDRASGDRPGGSYGRFDTIYGMRRGELGPAGLYNDIGRANISELGARIEIAPSKRWDAFVSYEALWLADRTDSFSTTGVRDISGQSGAFAGNQIDSRFRWWVMPAKLRFEVDGVLLAKGRFLQTAPNATVGKTTAYGAINFTAFF